MKFDLTCFLLFRIPEKILLVRKHVV